MKLFAFFLTCIAFHFEKAFAEKNTTLLFVQFLYRHGDRNPIELYPNDPNPLSAFKYGGLKQLTLLGRKQHYAMGKHFRSMYKDFMTFDPFEISVVSSYNERCVMSAETNLAAFYAPDSNWQFEDNFVWQPIVIRSLPQKQDKYLEAGSDCPRADEEERRILNSPEGQRFMAEHKEMYEKMSDLSGMDLANWTEASYFYDTVRIEKKFNLTVPTWVKPYYDELANVTNLAFYWSFNSPLMHRLRAGPLLQRMIGDMNKKINGELNDQKFKMYSAHDTTISVVLGALNLFNFLQPPYASTLLFELHRMSDGTNALRMLYINSSQPEEKIDDPHVLVLEGCSEFCPLSFFINFTKDLMPVDWDQECQLDKTFVEKIKSQQVTVGWFFVVIAVAIVSLAGYAVWRLYSRRQDKVGASTVNYNTLD